MSTSSKSPSVGCRKRAATGIGSSFHSRTPRAVSRPRSIAARELHGLFRGLANEAGCSGHSVRDHIRSKAAGLGGSSCAAIEGGRQAALGVREWNEDPILLAARFRHPSEGLFELVLTELDLQRANDGHRDDCGAGQHLLGVDERRQVDSRHAVAQSKRLLPRLDRPGVILARPTPQLHRIKLTAQRVDACEVCTQRALV